MAHIRSQFGGENATGEYEEERVATQLTDCRLQATDKQQKLSTLTTRTGTFLWTTTEAGADYPYTYSKRQTRI